MRAPTLYAATNAFPKKLDVNRPATGEARRSREGYSKESGMRGKTSMSGRTVAVTVHVVGEVVE